MEVVSNMIMWTNIGYEHHFLGRNFSEAFYRCRGQYVLLQLLINLVVSSVIHLEKCWHSFEGKLFF